MLGLAGTAVIAVTAIFTPGCTCAPQARRIPPTSIERVHYHGWTNALRLTSDQAEAIVVPEVGRVMSFRLKGGENVFWEDRSLDGKRGDPTGKEWINFGGDKTWPAPEADWGKYTGRKEWMPPAAFDSLPVKATIEGNSVVMTSPVDPHYGIRTIRRISLYGSQMHITTTYHRVSGEPSKVSVWVITQFREPVVVCVPTKTNSTFANGYYVFSNDPWTHLQRKGRHIEITRDPQKPHKMGGDAQQLLWVGEKETCLISFQRAAGEFPDRGASAEVYTNPNPKKYVELETLGPLGLMKPGRMITQNQNYLLERRTGGSLEPALRLIDR
jgi:hypothetical protein